MTPNAVPQTLDANAALVHTGVVLYEHDLAEATTRWTGAVEQVLPGELPSLSDLAAPAHHAFVHPEDRERVLAGWDLALRTNRGYRLCYRLMRPDGGTAEVCDSGTATGDGAAGRRCLRGFIFLAQAAGDLAVDEIASEPQFFRRVMVQSTVGVFRLAIDPPVPVNLAADQQAALIEERARLVDCNAAMAYHHEVGLPAELIGRPLAGLRLGDADQRRRIVDTFVRAGYSLKDQEITDRQASGELIGLANAMGIIRDGCLTEAYGSVRDVTEARHQEERLLDKESRLLLALEAANAMTWEWDVASGALAFDARIEAVLGYTPVELSGTFAGAMDLVHPDDSAGVAAMMQRAIEESAPTFELEFRLRATNGEWRWFFARGQAVEIAADGRPRRVIGTSVDITRRKQTEQALIDSEKLLRESQQIGHVGSWHYDLRSHETSWSDEVCRIFGLSPDPHRATFDQFLSMVHEEDRPTVEAAFARSVEAQVPFEIVHRLRLANGQVKYVHELAETEFASSGTPLRAVGIIQDITETKDWEARVHQLQAYLQNVIDSMPSALIGLDGEGRISLWNQRAQALTGIRHGAGMTLAEAFPMLADGIEPILDAQRRGQSYAVERTFVPTAPELQYWEIVLFPLKADGASAGVLRIDDVTKRVTMEAMLVHTERMMSLGTLAAGLAHEINNPLGGILQSVQNIRRRLSQDLPQNVAVATETGVDLAGVRAYCDRREIHRFLDMITEAAIQASEIITNMLQFSHKGGERGAGEDLSQLIDRVVDLAAVDYDLKKKYDFRHLTIVKDYAPDMPPVPCVASAIQQVLLNLLRNAAQAIHAQPDPADRQGPGRITIRLRAVDGQARITVADNGIGMADEVRRRVFEPFFTTKPPGVGTGLGLPVSYYIIRNDHDGDIEVESTPGHGTTFTVTLPLTPEDYRHDAP